MTSVKRVELKEHAVDICIDHFHHILLGGDQLTIARILGSQVFMFMYIHRLFYMVS